MSAAIGWPAESASLADASRISKMPALRAITETVASCTVPLPPAGWRGRPWGATQSSAGQRDLAQRLDGAPELLQVIVALEQRPGLGGPRVERDGRLVAAQVGRPT